MTHRTETILVHGKKGTDPLTGSVSFPIYQSATFRHPGLDRTTGYDYSRLKNPTREELEQTIAQLENGSQGFAFSSGMAAISTILKLFRSGAHFLVTDDLYGGVYRLLSEIYSQFGMTASYVDLTDISAVQQAIRPETAAILVELPTNPMLKIVDLRAISQLARQHGLLTIVDSTLLTPWLIKPLDLGADIVVHSASKYLAGHNDTIAGLAVVKNPELAERLFLVQKSEGAILAPFDSWLVLRGMKTLAVRMERQQQNALAIARWLQKHDQVAEVYFPGLTGHPGHCLLASQATGFGATLSFLVVDAALVAQVLDRVSLIYYAESLGGTETLITYPLQQTHQAIPAAMLQKQGINNRLLRLSAGLEHIDDLLADLDQALSVNRT